MGAPATLFDQARNVAQRFVTGPNAGRYVEAGSSGACASRRNDQMPNALAAKLRARCEPHHQRPQPASGRRTRASILRSGYGNGDVQNDFSTTSPPTYFTVRLNLHY
jgi:hypothetical protein